MEYSEFEEYKGNKIACDHCGREFEEGEIITVCEEKGYVFCFMNCMIAHVAVAREMMLGHNMRFGGSPVLPPVDPTPNYRPDEPIPIDPEKQHHFDGLRRLLDW